MGICCITASDNLPLSDYITENNITETLFLYVFCCRIFAYLPDNREYNNLTNTIYPEGIETVPKRFAISWRNKWMLKQADTVITYATHPSSGAWEFKKLAEKQGKTVVNIN